MKPLSPKAVHRVVGLLCAALFGGALSPHGAAMAPLLSAGGPTSATSQVMVTILDNPTPLAGGTKVLTPSSPGIATQSGGGATLDYSNASEGYITVSCRSASRIKVQVTKNGGTTYTYNLNGNGSYEVFPLTGGDGTYKVGVYLNVSGNQYAEALSTSINVALRSQALPYLYPNQYVNFSAGSQTVAMGEQLAGSASSDLEIVSNVYNYVIGNISYDTGKATTISQGGMSGYLPAVDNILASKKGICFDYAAVMATMLRTQQIPTRLEVGYVSGGAYHAWISTYIADVGWVNGVIQFDGKTWKLMDPTFASSGGASDSIMQFIGNGSNYQTQYVY